MKEVADALTQHRAVKHRAVQHPAVQRQTLVCLLAAQAIVIAPLFLYLPLWLGLIWLVAVVIRVQVHRGVWRYPGNRAKILLGIVCISGLFAHYGVSIGVEPMVSLLLTAFMLKLVEARQRRDILLMIFIGYVAVAGHFLFSQTVVAAAYGLISCIALLVAWRACFTSRVVGWGIHVKQSGALVMQTLPLMLLLFLLLPRLGPLWAVPSVNSGGTTGFSDTMAPGDIAALSLSSKLAFRVSFEGPEPLKSHMYWRGLVLDQFDGRSWSSSESGYGTPGMTYDGDNPENFWALDRAGSNTTFQYRVMLEPHHQRWLFFLETPVAVESNLKTVFTENHLLKTRRPVDKRIEYQVRSDPDAKRNPLALENAVMRRNLHLPQQPANPRTHALVRSWEGLSEREKINRALRFYRQEFSYTLRPPPLGTHSIDEFLFIARRGFCEHFAGSFVYLMRAAGIPARVVLGYQGGERSEVGDYWLVRQSASHAWAEVWLAGEGWLSIDPTSVIAPARIEQGLREALGADEIYLAGGDTLLGVQDWQWLRHMRHQWDAFGYAWHRSVLSYDSRAQAGLFKRLLGGSDAWRIGLALIVGGGLFVGLYGLVFWYGSRRPTAPLEVKLLRRAERRLGVNRNPGESVHQWAERAAREHPQQARVLLQIAQLFEATAYAGQRQSLYKLQSVVQSLRKS